MIITINLNLGARFAFKSSVNPNKKNNAQSFIKSNVLGVHNLLEAIRKLEKKTKNKLKFLQVSTDEVYGDICSYPGKLKLILSGFHEGALAARSCFKLARPNEKYRFEFTTTSKTVQERLGVKKSD